MKDQSPDITGGRRPPVILIVDDEKMVTESLRLLLQMETNYKILTFQSPLEALKTLQQTPVDLVITDYLMPEMDGSHFLLEAKKIYPDVPRIIPTGYADKENAIRAINEVGLFQYIETDIPHINPRSELVWLLHDE